MREASLCHIHVRGDAGAHGGNAFSAGGVSLLTCHIMRLRSECGSEVATLGGFK
jgi:hypothetical protein